MRNAAQIRELLLNIKVLDGDFRALEFDEIVQSGSSRSIQITFTRRLQAFRSNQYLSQKTSSLSIADVIKAWGLAYCSVTSVKESDGILNIPRAIGDVYEDCEEYRDSSTTIRPCIHEGIVIGLFESIPWIDGYGYKEYLLPVLMNLLRSNSPRRGLLRLHETGDSGKGRLSQAIRERNGGDASILNTKAALKDLWEKDSEAFKRITKSDQNIHAFVMKTLLKCVHDCNQVHENARLLFSDFKEK